MFKQTTNQAKTTFYALRVAAIVAPFALTLPLMAQISHDEGNKVPAQSQPKLNSEITFDTPPPVPRPKPEFRVWTHEEITEAKKQCDKVLAEWDIAAKELPPIADYDKCGDPSPLLVSQIFTQTNGRTISVNISPPATLNCKMVGKIAQWINSDVQKTAQKLFTQPITKIHNVASYHCRKRYNALVGKMSEHAFANALDISSFSLEDGTKISLLKHWTKKPKSTEASYKEQPKKETPQTILATNTPTTIKMPVENKSDKETAESMFLKTIHKNACGRFSTVLGPEANAAHADHFHLDLGRGGRYQICE